MAVTVLLIVLASASAVVQARRGRWWTAVAVLLPSFGVAALLAGLQGPGPSLLWLAGMLVVAGFGAEGMAHWRARTPGKAQAGE